MKTIRLTQGYETVVDDEDYERVSQRKWFAHVRKNKKVYAETSVGRRLLGMQRFITGDIPNSMVDHANGNTLDNQRNNLRVCTSKQNTRNRIKQSTETRSKYKGVTMSKGQKKWRAQIKLDFKLRDHHIGYFYTETEAAQAYDIFAKAFFGEFANLNFPETK